ncbi:MAG: hypothetical protein IJJ33_01375 [Victivallales bacterium]|nr:hypothetical protein [Victivallales bacterium]
MNVLHGQRDDLDAFWWLSLSPRNADYGRIPDGCLPFDLGCEHGVNLDDVSENRMRPGDECIVYHPFTLAADSFLGFGVGCDTCLEVWLNGERIYSNCPGFDGLQQFASAEDHGFTGLGRKGDNLLAVRLTHGRGKCIFFIREKSYEAAHASLPLRLVVDTGQVIGHIKPMNAVNNGPIGEMGGRGNLALWQTAQIPWCRTHDASFCGAYGGEHTVDIQAVFPDFAKDAEAPDSYHFSETDRYLKKIREGGSRVFYRLGSKIEHAPEKYGTQVPADFRKWAVICEHIIRHFNEGWADGFHWNIEYWELWNEPDHLLEENGNPTWQGTPEQFFELYRVAATHLKRCFPHLKIGGPALRGRDIGWAERFLSALTSDGVRTPLDFLSWHVYAPSPAIYSMGRRYRRLLDSYGYERTESVLDEWNYARGKGVEEFNRSIRCILGMKGAAFTCAAMCAGQNSPIDMMMYYDARPSVYNGLFDFYTFRPLKTYFVFRCWSLLAELENQIAVDTQDKSGLFAVGAAQDGRVRLLLSRFFEEQFTPDDLEVRIVCKDAPLDGARLFLLDDSNDLTEIPFDRTPEGEIVFRMGANTVAFLEK